jgi:hypothetical protein
MAQRFGFDVTADVTAPDLNLFAPVLDASAKSDAH